MFLMTCLGLLSGIWYGLKMNQDDVFICQSLIQSSFVLPMDSFQYFLKVCLLEGIMVLFLFLCNSLRKRACRSIAEHLKLDSKLI